MPTAEGAASTMRDETSATVRADTASTDEDDGGTARASSSPPPSAGPKDIIAGTSTDLHRATDRYYDSFERAASDLKSRALEACSFGELEELLDDLLIQTRSISQFLVASNELLSTEDNRSTTATSRDGSATISSGSSDGECKDERPVGGGGGGLTTPRLRTLEEGFHGTLAQLNGQDEFIVFLQQQLNQIVASAGCNGAFPPAEAMGCAEERAAIAGLDGV